MVVPIRRHGDLLYKSLTGGQGDGYARIHGHLDIGQDNRYEQVEPQARIANTCQRHGSCFSSGVTRRLIFMVVPIRRHGGLLLKKPCTAHRISCLLPAKISIFWALLQVFQCLLLCPILYPARPKAVPNRAGGSHPSPREAKGIFPTRIRTPCNKMLFSPI